ncbi:MAG: SLC13 family permease [Pseudomonadales bacterium]|nr:SLC13 family permease [Pseudomonadales bacterium]
MSPSIVAPDLHAIAAMVLTVFALYLFTRDRIPLEMTSLGLIAVLAIGFTLFPYPGIKATEFFHGFAHEALIAVCALLVLGQGLVRTGALEPIGTLLSRIWGKAPYLSFLLTLVLSAVLSAFINNTPIVVLLLPILISVCLRTGASPTGILMPMGFATLVGGMATTIGTSTNLLVVSVAADMGLDSIGMFDFVFPASIGAGVAILYLWLIAPRILPARQIELSNPSPRVFDARLHIGEDSPFVDRTLAEAKAAAGGDMHVVRIRRGDAFVLPLPDVRLRAGDRLRVRDTPNRLKGFEKALKARMYSGDHIVDEAHPLLAENQVLAEIAVVPGSTLDRANLKYTRFLDRFQLAVLALHRAGKDIWHAKEEIQDVILQPGDILLVQGPAEQISALKRSTDFLVVDASMDLPKTSKAFLALAVLAGVVLLSAAGILPIAVSAISGAVILLLTRCLDLEAAVRAISTSVYFVVVASLALGHALIETGAIDYITSVFLSATDGASPTVILGGLMLMLAILTNVVTNNAAAVIGTPIAVSIAVQLNLPPEPFVLAVLFGANLSYATPMAYNTNLLVMSAGNYTFADFVKVGVPLSILMWVTLTWVLSAMYF